MSWFSEMTHSKFWAPYGNLTIPGYLLYPRMLFSSKHRGLRKYYKVLLQRVPDMETIQAITFRFAKSYARIGQSYNQPYLQRKMEIFRASVTTGPS